MTPLQIPAAQRPLLSGGSFEASIYDADLGLSSVVRTPFRVECSWYMEGPFSSLFAVAGNDWRLQVAYESIGAGNEGIKGTVPATITMAIPADPNHTTRYNYSGRVDFVAADLPPGTYHLTALLTGEVPSGTNPSMTAYQDLGVIHVVP